MISNRLPPDNSYNQKPIGASQPKAPAGPQVPAAESGTPPAAQSATPEPASTAEPDTKQVREINRDKDPFDPEAGGVSFPSSTQGKQNVSIGSVSSLRSDDADVSPMDMVMGKSFVDSLSAAREGISLGVQFALERSGVTADELMRALELAAVSVDPGARLPSN